MTRTFWTSLLLSCSLAIGSASMGWAADSSSSAEQFIQDRHGQLIGILQQPKTSARESKVSTSIDDVFDYPQLAARSLGEEWEKRTDVERQQFTQLLVQLVRQSYRKSLDSTLGYNVEYRGSRRSGDDTVVATVAKHKTDNRKSSVSVDYVLNQRDGKWRAVDIVVEGSSLVGNYRSQFTRIIKKGGFSELMTKMKRKLEKGER